MLQLKATYPKYFVFLAGYGTTPIELRRVIDTVFSLRVDPQPSNFIDESNLRTFILAPMDDDVANSIHVVTASTIATPPSLTIQGGVGRLSSIATTSTPTALPILLAPIFIACRNENMKFPILMNRTIPMLRAPIETALTPQGSSLRR